MTKTLSVWTIDFTGAPVLAGEFAHDTGRTFFQYAEDYLASGDAHPLDPLNLPLRPGLFRGRGLNPPFLALADTLPDAWGMAILEKRCRQSFRNSPERALEHMDSSGVGNLFFSETGRKPAPPRWVPMSALESCIAESRAFELREADAVFKYLEVSGTSAGGARPKASFIDEENRVWLVKFPSKQDSDSEVNARVEYEGIRFARRIGLPVAETRIIRTEKTACLATRRFDILPECGEPFYGRFAVISLSTLAGGMEQAESGYEVLGTLIRRISASPSEDVLNFFRHMLLNCCIVNTDDHLKNFSIVRRAEGWRLSPAYDLIGNLWGMDTHTMPVVGRKTGFSSEHMLKAGRAMGLSSDTVGREIRSALEAAGEYMENISRIPGTGQLCLAVRKRLEGLGYAGSATC